MARLKAEMAGRWHRPGNDAATRGGTLASAIRAPVAARAAAGRRKISRATGLPMRWYIRNTS